MIKLCAWSNLQRDYRAQGRTMSGVNIKHPSMGREAQLPGKLMGHHYSAAVGGFQHKSSFLAVFKHTLISPIFHSA